MEKSRPRLQPRISRLLPLLFIPFATALVLFNAWLLLHPNSAQMHVGRVIGLQLATIGIGTLLLMAALHYWITRRIEQLTQAITTADSTQTAALAAMPDEIGRLATAFQTLQSGLHEERLQLARQRNFYRILIETERLTKRLREREALFQAICQMVQEVGEFELVWIGLENQAENRIEIGAAAGKSIHLLERIHKSLKVRPTTPEEESLFYRALHDNRSQRTVDYRSEGPSTWGKGLATQSGIRSVAVIPIPLRGLAEGALLLYSKEPAFFTDELMALLEEMCSSLGFALQSIEDEVSRRQTETERSRWAGLVHELTRQFPGALYSTRELDSGAFQVLYISPGIEALIGITPEQAYAAGIQLTSRMTPATRALYLSSQLEARLTLSSWDHEFQIAHPDGSQRWLRIKSSPQRLQDGSLLWHGALLDTTRARTQAEELLKLSIVARETDNLVVIENGARRIEWINEAFTTITGYLPEEVLGQDSRSFISAELIDTATQQRLLAAMIGGEDFSVELPNCKKSGEAYWLALNATTVRDENGAIRYYFAIGRDITAQKRAEEELRLAASVFDDSGEAIVITDHKSHILRINRTLTELTGYSAQALIGQKPWDLVTAQPLWQEYRLPGQNQQSRRLWRAEVWLRFADGSSHPVGASISEVHDEKGEVTHYIAAFADISERKAADARIEQLAYYDTLTGLPNRLLLQDRLIQAITHATRNRQGLALLFLDIDQFKSINDSLGHPVGDQLLALAAKRISSVLRKEDTVARLGGDEFVVLLPHEGEAHQQISGDVAQVAEKIRLAMAQPVTLEQHQFSVSVSIGIALYPDDGQHSADLLQHADTALYRAKEEGRNAYRFFTPSMNVEAVEQLHLTNALRQALEQQTFELYYQPQMACLNNEVIGVEALLRWPQADNSFIPPDKFIPLAEKIGLIHPLGNWVLRQAFQQLTRWDAEGIFHGHESIAVNISAHQFQHGDFVAEIAAMAQEYGVDPHRIELELTEGTLLHDIDTVAAKLQALRDLGIQIAIDDFGTGYSSLAYLKRLPLDKLKIDQSFIHDLELDDANSEIVRVIIGIARQYQLQVVAEGVESIDQLHFLRDAGCQSYQGYLMSPALPADQFATLWRQLNAVPKDQPPAATTPPH